MAKKMEQRHGLYYQTVGGPSPREGEHALLELQDWVINTACAAHDAHNSLMWGLRPFAADEAETFRKLHVSVESLRNSYDLLHRFLKPFIAAHLQFDEREYDYQEVYSFWLLLSVEEEVAAELAELNLHWEGNVLWVSSKSRDQEGLLEKVSACALAVFKFKDFTASRWLTVGCSCRSLVGSLAIGLSGLVDMIRKDKSASDYYMHGFGQLEGVLGYAIVAALSSHLCDKLLLELLKDDRIAMRRLELEQSMRDELQQMSQIGHYVWSKLAALLAGTTARRVRSDVIQAALASAAFFQRRALSVVAAYPWKLCAGDIADNLQALAEQDDCPSTDPITSKVHQLLCIGWPREKLIDGLQRMGEVHWTTLIQEQGHGSVTLMHRVHSQYSAQMLTQRAFLHMTRGLFADPEGDRVARLLRQLEAKIASAEHKQPHKITGRHVFLGDCMEALKSSVAQEKRAEQARNLMARHGRVYHAFPQETKDEYERRAANMTVAKRASCEGEVSRLLSQKIAQSSPRKEADAAPGPDLVMASCKFTEADWTTIASMWNSGEFSLAAVKRARESAMKGHLDPSDEVKRQVDKVPVPSGQASKPAAPWCKAVCWNRDEFHQCALVFETDGCQQAFALLFAVQKPLVAAFMPLEKMDVVLPAKSLAEVEAGILDYSCLPRSQYKADWGRVVWNEDIATTDDTVVFVIPGFTHTPHQCESHWDPVPLPDFLGDLYRVAQEKARKAQEKPPQDVAPSLLDAHPWLKPFLAPSDSAEEPNQAAQSSTAPTFTPAEALSDEEREAMYIALAAQRRKCQAEAGQPLCHFKTSIIGGAWIMANRGVAFDAIKASPKTAPATAWMRQYFGQVQTSFAYRKYGDEACSAFALLWCRRMEYFYSIYLSQDDANYAYKAADIDNAPPADNKFTELGRHTPLYEACQARLSEIMAFVPT
jgi:hypothetical protein